MSTLETLKKEVEIAKQALIEAGAALIDFSEQPENNVYASLEDAGELEGILSDIAFNDCEGAHNCGAPEYSRGFMVGGKQYVAKLTVEYNRHDKIYYYIEQSEFSISEAE